MHFVFCFILQPPITNDEKAAFDKLAGADGEIDAFELQKILNDEFMKGYLIFFLYCLFKQA